jgi:hypothetical protein
MTPSPVTEAYTVPFKFTGKIDRVTIELKPEGAVEVGRCNALRFSMRTHFGTFSM